MLLYLVLCTGITLAQSPSPAITIVSAANYSNQLCPGSIASIFGTSLSPITAQARLDASGELPTVLGGTVVEVNGIAAGIYYVSGTQINFVIPRAVQPGPATVVIRSSVSGLSVQTQINVADIAPAIFILPGARPDIGAVRNAVSFGLEPFRLETPENAGCDKRTYLAIYATGLVPAVQRGLRVQVEIHDAQGQTRLVDVVYAGPSSFPGLDQINVSLPPELDTSETITLALRVGSITSNLVSVRLLTGTAPTSLCLANVFVSSQVVTAGTAIRGTVTISSIAPQGGIVVNLQSSVTGLQVPATVTIPGGQSSVGFDITADAALAVTSATITATLGPVSLTAQVSINLICVLNASVLGDVVIAGTSVTGQVVLTAPAPAGGILVSLHSNSAQVQVPDSVMVPAGQVSATFNITATSAAADVAASISASLGACAVAALNITVTPQICVSGVGLSATAVVGGASLTGAVTLPSPAPSGGVVVDLQSNNALVQIPATVTIAAGQTSANFNVTTSSTSAAATVAINASRSGCAGASVNLTVNVNTPVCVSGVALTANSVVGGNGLTGTVTLTAPAPSGGIVVSLQSNNALVQVPATVTIAAGQTSTNFSVTTSATNAAATVAISASLSGCTGASVNLTVNVNTAVCVAGVALTANAVVGGNGLTGTVTLTAPAPSGGLVVTLASNNALVQLPATVTIAPGQTSATFAITTSATGAAATVAISASLSGCTGATVNLTVNAGTTVCVSGVALTANAIVGGNGLTGTVTLTAPAPSGGLVVSLQSNNTLVQVPATVTIAAGQTSATFNVTTSVTGAAATVAIRASLSGCTAASVTLTVNTSATVCVSGVALTANAIVGGNGLTGTVNLTAAAPSGGLVVSLQSNNTLVQVPATVTIAAGQTSATFNITTSVTGTAATVAISASLSGCTTVAVTLTVNANITVCVSGVALTPNAILGGNGVTGTVMLTGPAPSGGVVVSLHSDNTLVQVPASVTIAAGQTSATFAVTTSVTGAAATVAISASLSGCTTVSVNLTVNTTLTVCVSSLALTANAIVGGNGVTGTVTLTAPAPAGGLLVSLHSDNTLVQVPATVLIAAGQTSATFGVTTSVTGAAATVTISASLGGCVGVSVNLTLNVSVTVGLSSLTVSTASVVGGTSLTGTVTLNAPAPAGGQVVSLLCDNLLAQVPSTVTVPAGQTSANFTITTSVVTSSQPVTVQASANATSASAQFTLTL